VHKAKLRHKLPPIRTASEITAHLLKTASLDWTPFRLEFNTRYFNINKTKTRATAYNVGLGVDEWRTLAS